MVMGERVGIKSFYKVLKNYWGYLKSLVAKRKKKKDKDKDPFIYPLF